MDFTTLPLLKISTDLLGTIVGRYYSVANGEKAVRHKKRKKYFEVLPQSVIKPDVAHSVKE